MDKIKQLGRNLSLRKSLILYVIVFVLLALILSVTTFAICGNAADRIRSSYPTSGERYYLTNEQGEQLGEGALIGNTSAPISEYDERMIAILEVLPTIAATVYSAICIITAALLFYRNKLKKPLAELMAASEKISNSDLDFSIEYDSKDELGQLCTSFEIMRTTLANNFSEMWRQVEERKQLNAAFAHDLRTPLTVLKGYNEMLQTSEHIQTREIAVTMGKHISRMETYVSSMSNLQRMEDTQPEYKLISLQSFLSSLYESVNIVCAQNGKTLLLQNEVSIPQLSLDSSFVSQVCNNLISNAVRYAGNTVTLSFTLENGGLLLSVSDDGKGFDKNNLHKVTAPYFTEETDHSEHFGLGLYICKLLCEHHGGYLKIDNISNGAKVSAFFKSPPCR
jgi:signal transduction histidine kinase